MIGIAVMIIVLSLAMFYQRSEIKREILEKLDGEIYYLKRVDGVRMLFKSDADLSNEQVIYSHKGRGMDSSGEYNDNILSFYYDQETESIEFIAMNEGEWCRFILKEGSEEPLLIKRNVMQTSSSSYLSKSHEGSIVYQKNGSLYIGDGEGIICIKAFYGLYDDKFTGYRPVGFAPDGEYLIYHTNGHLTSMGTIVELLLNDSPGNTYIMDLKSMKRTPYVKAANIQWVMD